MYLPPEGILILTIESSKPDQEGNFQNGEIPTATKTLCVIFTILVSFLRGDALFASKAKIKIV